jgi:hypothetical protein
MLLATLSAKADNVVAVSSASGHPNDEVTLQLSLGNTDAVMAFQTEIPLGANLTYVANSVALNPDRVTDHSVTAAVVGGNLRIFVFSLSLSPFVGNEGTLLSFTLKLKNEPGNNIIDVSNSMLSDAAGNALGFNVNNGVVTILSPKMRIDTGTINYGHVPIWSEYSGTARVSNVGNEPLTITEIVFSDDVFSCPHFAETTVMVGQSASFTISFAPMVKGAVNATATIVSNSISGDGVINLVADPFAVNEMHIENTSGYCDSIVKVPLRVNNMENIVGFQLDMIMPSSLEYVGFELSDRKTDHLCYGVEFNDTLRLMAFSPSSSAFLGDDGVIAILKVKLRGLYGNYYLNPFKAVLADAAGDNVISACYQGYVNIRSPRIDGNRTLDMGSSPVTETVTKEYVVRNNGNAPLRLDNVVFDQQDWEVSETFPLVVGQNSNTTLHVSYSRELKGDFSATMKIYSNDPVNGLKNVGLSGHRYEPNSLSIEADPFILGNGDVAVDISMDNYTDIVALQADFVYPYQEYSVSQSDFALTGRFANHLLYPTQVNDSTYRVMVFSMQNAVAVGHEGAVLNVTMHPIGEPENKNYLVSVKNVVLSGLSGANEFTGNDVSAQFNFVVVRVINLTSGCNWVSFNVEITLDDLKAALVAVSPNAAITIKSQTQKATYNPSNGRWTGRLTTFDLSQMYKITVSSACEITLEGVRINPAEHPVTITPGANWIAYPLNTSKTPQEVFTGFAVPGDMVKSQSQKKQYNSNGRWTGQLGSLEPGKGYIYTSSATEDRVFTFPTF